MSRGHIEYGYPSRIDRVDGQKVYRPAIETKTGAPYTGTGVRRGGDPLVPELEAYVARLRRRLAELEARRTIRGGR